MKKRLKFKQLILGIGLSILGLLTFNSAETKAQFNVINSNPNVQTGEYVYKIENNYYYSNGNNNYIFNNSTYEWSPHTWNGLNISLYGHYFWTDGDTYYYGGTNTSQQYYYDIENNTWINYPSSVATYGNNIWTDGINTYYSSASTQKIWNKSNQTWSNMSWSGLTSFNGYNIWKDNNGNIYYGAGASQYKLNISTSTWSQFGFNSPSTLTSLNGQDVWTDGFNTYYSGNSAGASAVYNYIFDGIDTWSAIQLNGFDRFQGRYVYNVENNTFMTYYFAQYGWNLLPSGGITEEDLEEAYQEGYNDGISSTDGYNVGYQDGFNAGVEVGYQDGYNAGYQIGYEDGYVENNTIPNIYIQSANMTFNNGLFPVQISITDYINNLNGTLDFTQLYNYNFNGIPNQNILVYMILTTNISINDNLYFEFVENDILTNNFWIILGDSNTSCNTENYGTNCVRLEYNDIIENNNLINLSELYPNLVIENINSISLSFPYRDNFLYGVKSIIDSSLVGTPDTQYDIGYNVGYIIGKNDGLLIGRTEAYNLGYEAGLDYQFTNENTITGMMGTLFTMPVEMFKTIFNFEFLGVNLAGFFLSLVTLLVVIWLIKKFI